jgi:DNA-binding NarL/FixJ family response regulator
MATTVGWTSVDLRHGLLARAAELRDEAAELEREAVAWTLPADPADIPIQWSDVLNGANLERATGVESPNAFDPRRQSAARHSVVLARLGRSDEALRLAAYAETASPFDFEIVIGITLTRALIALTAGEPTRAFDTLMSVIASAHGHKANFGLSALMGVFAESALCAERQDEARQVLDAWAVTVDIDMSDPDHPEPFVAHRLVRMDSSEHLAAVVLTDDRFPALAMARLQLATGMWLRRQGRITEARAYLQTAHFTLSRSGGRPWETLCLAEADAAQLRLRPVNPSELLTPHQLSVARLAAQGLNNREIADLLSMPPRAISSHLSRVFPTLGVNTRYQIAPALLLDDGIRESI